MIEVTQFALDDISYPRGVKLELSINSLIEF